MEIVTLSSAARERRQAVKNKVHHLQALGICPTCQQLREGNVYSPTDDLFFYEDEQFLCLLEQYPRNPGHSILIVKPHYEDIVQLPVEHVGIVYQMIHTTIRVLKQVLSAEKMKS